MRLQRVKVVGLLFFSSFCLAVAPGKNTHQAGGGSSAPNTASGGVECSVAGLTDQCRAFSESDKSRFDLPDGTFIPNPVPEILLDAKLSPEQKFQAKTEKKRQVGTLKMQLEEKLFDLSENMKGLLENDDPAGKKIERSIKHGITRDPSFLGAILRETPGGVSGIRIPWPLHAPKAVEEKPIKEVRKALTQAISPSVLKQLIALSSQAEKAHDAFDEQSRRLEGSYVPDKAFQNQRSDRARELFKIAQKNVLRVITGDAPESELTAKQKDAVQRIKTIQYTGDQDAAAKESPFCQAGPNGFYTPSKHAFTLCGGLSWLPDNTVLGVIAHEIGHAIDPCACQFELHEVNSDKLSEIVTDEQEHLTKEAMATEGRIRAVRLIVKHRNSAETKYMGGMTAIESSPEGVEFLKSKGILRTVAEATPPSEYLFKSVVDCLKGPMGGSFIAQDDAKAQETAASVGKLRANRFGADAEKETKRVKHALSAHPECNVGGHSQMSEAMADWISASAMGLHLKDTLKGKPLSTPNERMSLSGSLLADACAEITAFQTRDEKTLGDTLAGIDQDLKASEDVHPPAAARIENILLRDPHIRQALGCPMVPACERK